MIDYWLAIFIILFVMILGLSGYYVPAIGVIGLILGLVFLIPLMINPTVIIGIGFNTATGLSYSITELVTELRIFSIVSFIVSMLGTITGGVRRGLE